MLRVHHSDGNSPTSKATSALATAKYSTPVSGLSSLPTPGQPTLGPRTELRHHSPRRRLWPCSPSRPVQAGLWRRYSVLVRSSESCVQPHEAAPPSLLTARALDRRPLQQTAAAATTAASVHPNPSNQDPSTRTRAEAAFLHSLSRRRQKKDYTRTTR